MKSMDTMYVLKDLASNCFHQDIDFDKHKRDFVWHLEESKTRRRNCWQDFMPIAA